MFIYWASIILYAWCSVLSVLLYNICLNPLKKTVNKHLFPFWREGNWNTNGSQLNGRGRMKSQACPLGLLLIWEQVALPKPLFRGRWWAAAMLDSTRLSSPPSPWAQVTELDFGIWGMAMSYMKTLSHSEYFLFDLENDWETELVKHENTKPKIMNEEIPYEASE